MDLQNTLKWIVENYGKDTLLDSKRVISILNDNQVEKSFILTCCLEQNNDSVLINLNENNAEKTTSALLKSLVTYGFDENKVADIINAFLFAFDISYRIDTNKTINDTTNNTSEKNLNNKTFTYEDLNLPSTIIPNNQSLTIEKDFPDIEEKIIFDNKISFCILNAYMQKNSNINQVYLLKQGNHPTGRTYTVSINLNDYINCIGYKLNEEHSYSFYTERFKNSLENEAINKFDTEYLLLHYFNFKTKKFDLSNRLPYYHDDNIYQIDLNNNYFGPNHEFMFVVSAFFNIPMTISDTKKYGIFKSTHHDDYSFSLPVHTQCCVGNVVSKKIRNFNEINKDLDCYTKDNSFDLSMI